MYPLSSAFVNVEMDGENKAACIKLTMLPGVAEFCIKALAWAVVYGIDMLICHRVLGPERVPERMALFSKVIVTV